MCVSLDRVDLIGCVQSSSALQTASCPRERVQLLICAACEAVPCSQMIHERQATCDMHTELHSVLRRVMCRPGSQLPTSWMQPTRPAFCSLRAAMQRHWQCCMPCTPCATENKYHKIGLGCTTYTDLIGSVQSTVPPRQPAPHERDAAYEAVPSRMPTQAGEPDDRGPGAKRKAVVGAKFSLPEQSAAPG